MKRGEIRWYTFRPSGKRRPILLLTCDAVIEQLGEIIAAPVTRTIRGLSTELVLTPDDGMPVACAANFDHVSLAQRARIGGLISDLRVERWSEARSALLASSRLVLEFDSGGDLMATRQSAGRQQSAEERSGRVA